MRWLPLFALLAAQAQAGPWGVDLGLLAGVGPSRFAGEPAGLAPSGSGLLALVRPTVKASGGTSLLGSAGFDVSLHYKRRWTLSLQPQWQGRSLLMDEDIELPGTRLQRKTVWEWQAVVFPLSLHYSRPLARGPGWAVLLRGGAGLWYASVQSRRKTLESGVGSPLERPWAGPPDDWGPLLALGVDWLTLPRGSRAVGFEVRADRGMALQDPAAGAGLAAWGLQGVLVLPVWMGVL